MPSIRSADGSLENQFELYRQHGDPDRLAEVFDQSAPRLLRLALHLAPTSADAEDLVQATYLRVIEIADRYSRERPLMPWLCGILEHEARRQRRTRNRRIDSERLPAANSPAPLDPLAGIERDELRARIEQALGDLPVVYRTVVTLKLQHSLSPAEIAVALERSPVAVRTQLHRGLRMLRAALPQTVGLAAISAITAGRGLAAVRSTVLEHVKVSVTVPAVLHGLGWGVLMSKSAKVLLAALFVLLVGVVGYVVWPSVDPAVEGTSVTLGTTGGGVGSPKPVTTTPSSVDLEGSSGRSPVSELDEVEVDASAGASLWVRVCYADDHSEAVSGIPVWVSADNGSGARRNPVTTGADGKVLITGLTPGRQFVRLDRDGPSLSTESPAGHIKVVDGRELVATRIELYAGQEAELELAIDRRFTVRGRVVDAGGEPVPGASIWSARLSARPHPSICVAQSDVEGRFVVPAFGMNHWLTARHPKHGPSQSYQPRNHGGDEVEAEVVLAELGGTVRGLVVGADGSAIAGADLIIGRDVFRGDIQSTREGMVTSNALPVRLWSSLDGEYQLAGLAPGRQFLWAVADGYTARVMEFEIVAGEVLDLEILLDLGATVSGRLMTPDRDLMQGVQVTAWSIPGGIVDPGTGFVRPVASVRSAVDGSYRLIGLPVGKVRLRADAHGYAAFASELLLAAEQAASVDINLAPLCDIHGVVRDASGRPLSHWRVIAEPVRGGDAIRVALGVDGSFAIAADSKKSYLLVVEQPGGEHGMEAQVRIPCVWLGEVAGNAGEQNITIPSAVLSFGGLRGKLGGMPDNAGKSWIRLLSLDDSARHTACSLDGFGQFDTGALVSGRYQLVAQMLGSKSMVALGEWTVGQGDTVDLGVLPLPELGLVRVEVTGSQSQSTVHARLLDIKGNKVGELYGKNGAAEQSLAPGRYRVVPWTLDAYGLASQWEGRTVEVRAGKVTEIEFDEANKK